jgi:hypothetical protein
MPKNTWFVLFENLDGKLPNDGFLRRTYSKEEALSHFKEMGGGSWLSKGGVRVITDTGTFIATGGTNWDEL